MIKMKKTYVDKQIFVITESVEIVGYKFEEQNWSHLIVCSV